MGSKRKAPTVGAATPSDGLASADSEPMTPSSLDSDAAVHDSTIEDAFTWVFITPTITEDDLEDAILKAHVRIYEDFKATGSLVRFHNELVQLASEIERIAEAV